jgi:hypothetical protein
MSNNDDKDDNEGEEFVGAQGVQGVRAQQKKKVKIDCGPQRSLRIMSSVSVWSGGIQRSQRIASQSHPTRDNLPAQRKVIAICCRIIGNRFRVHLPRCGAPGLSTLQLMTFASLDYTVPYFSLGRVFHIFGLFSRRIVVAIL